MATYHQPSMVDERVTLSSGTRRRAHLRYLRSHKHGQDSLQAVLGVKTDESCLTELRWRRQHLHIVRTKKTCACAQSVEARTPNCWPLSETRIVACPAAAAAGVRNYSGAHMAVSCVRGF